MNYIGIDLGGTNIKGALVSAEGEILKEHSIPTRVDLGPEAVAGRIGQVIAQLSIGEDTVGGVGVGCPGTVDDASGIVRFAANLNFVNFDLRSALRAHTALPIHLGNDANAAALGEALFGCGRGAESTIVVTLGTGVGGGIVIKYNANQRYTTDAVSGAVFQAICQEAGVPVQRYSNRADLPGGSTLGNISTAHLSVPTVDIGLPQLAMHSVCETAGAADTDYLVKAMTAYFSRDFHRDRDGGIVF